MNLRATEAGWNRWFTTQVAATLPVILLLSGCAMTSAPRPSPSESPGRFRYNHPLFIMELKNIEVFDEEIKLTLMYTNRTGKPQHACFAGAGTYLVDNLGNRYPRVTNSFGGGRRDWPPQIGETIWISYAKVGPDASSVNLVMSWLITPTTSSSKGK